MCVSMHVLKPFHAHVSVYLGGRQRNVTEQLLDRAKVRASLDEVRRERVSQSVRRDVRDTARSLQLPVDDPTHGFGGKRVSPR